MRRFTSILQARNFQLVLKGLKCTYKNNNQMISIGVFSQLSNDVISFSKFIWTWAENSTILRHAWRVDVKRLIYGNWNWRWWQWTKYFGLKIYKHKKKTTILDNILYKEERINSKYLFPWIFTAENGKRASKRVWMSRKTERNTSRWF